MKRRSILQFISVTPIFIALPFRYAWAQTMVFLDPLLSPILDPPPRRRQGPPRPRSAEASWVYHDEPILVRPEVSAWHRRMTGDPVERFKISTIRHQPVPEEEINHDDDPQKGPPWYDWLVPLEPHEKVVEADWERW